MKSNGEDGEDGMLIARMVAPLTETFGWSRGAALAAIVVVVVGLGSAVFWVVHAAPPRTLTITSGPPGSSFMTYAENYRSNIAVLSKGRVEVVVLPSQGSLQNLQRLYDPKFHVDVGFVQGGVTNAIVDGVTNVPANGKVQSLGSIAHQPLLIFYRGDAGIKLLSELKGKRVVVGPEGSGTRSLAMTLLALNGITNQDDATLLNFDAASAASGLTNGTVDAVFLMGDSASPQMMRQLLVTPGVHIYDFDQADAYTRRVTYLNRLEFPMGAIDFGKNIPAQDLHLVGPTVELLARPNLNGALADLLLEAAQQAHSSANLMRRKGEFPAALEHDFPISDEAQRYYKSGKGFMYRKLPFQWASLVNRILLAFVPMVVVLIPALRAIPAVFKWRVRLKLYRRYNALLALERDLDEEARAERRTELLAELDRIETAVNHMKVPVSFADQFYVLRGHIGFVRGKMSERKAPVH